MASKINTNNNLIIFYTGHGYWNEKFEQVYCFSMLVFKVRDAFLKPSAAFEELNTYPSRKAMTSGNLKEVPDKSVFLKFLVKRLSQNDAQYLASEQLFASFKEAVINNSPNNQIPHFCEIKETGDEGGDFFFIKKAINSKNNEK